MTQRENERISMAGFSPYKASLTREQFLFYEMRIAAKLMCEGLSEDEIIERIILENLFQYPTERSIKGMAQACVKRLKLISNDSLIEALATQSTEIAKQICLYALMKYNGLVCDFMLTVIGEKYQSKDNAFSRVDLNIFFLRLQEQDDVVPTWSDSTIVKLKQVLTKVLVENDYLDNTKSSYLNSVLLDPMLENTIRSKGEQVLLPAFNCFS